MNIDGKATFRNGSCSTLGQSGGASLTLTYPIDNLRKSKLGGTSEFGPILTSFAADGHIRGSYPQGIGQMGEVLGVITDTGGGNCTTGIISAAFSDGGLVTR